MNRKPIRIDWDDLEVAFNNANEEIVYYLDLVTGHVVMEGEGDDRDDDPDLVTAGSGEPSRVDDATRGYIDPLAIERKLGWMKSFLEDTKDLDADLAAKLRRGLDADDPAPAITQALAEHPDERDRWYLYRSDCLHDLIEAWIDRHGIQATNPPPWSP